MFIFVNHLKTLTAMKPNRIIVFIAIAAMALSLFCIPCHAQDKCDKPFEIDLPAEGKDVLLVCDQQPEFPGGMRALMDYLKKVIRYPKECVENRNEGKAFVRFIVEKNGKIKKVELARSSGNSLLDKEAIRVVKKMPRWNPGTIYNKPEGMAVTIPVEFRLDTIDKVVESPIVGVWQQCVVKQNAAGKLDVNVGAAIKVYDNDNTYYSLFPYRNNISGFVVQKGCYDIVDDNTFHEKILSHFNKPWEGTVSVMNYEFIDEEKMIMKIVYTNTSNNFTDTEFWLRIKPLE